MKKTKLASYLAKRDFTKTGPPRGAADIPEFVQPQLCKLVTRAPSGDDWVHEIKLDGYRMQMRVDDGDA